MSNVCEICKKAFYSKQTKERHMERIHPDEGDEDEEDEDEEESDVDSEDEDGDGRESEDDDDEEDREHEEGDVDSEVIDDHSSESEPTEIEQVIAEAIEKKIDINTEAWEKIQDIFCSQYENCE